MPEVALASALMVPVWAIAVTVAFRVPFSVRLSLIQEDNEKLDDYNDKDKKEDDDYNDDIKDDEDSDKEDDEDSEDEGDEE